MDRYGVRDALFAAGMSPAAFQITGVHEQRPVPPDFCFLRPAPGGGWEIGAYERGGYDVRATHPTEAAACAEFYRALTGRALG